MYVWVTVCLCMQCVCVCAFVCVCTCVWVSEWVNLIMFDPDSKFTHLLLFVLIHATPFLLAFHSTFSARTKLCCWVFILLFQMHSYITRFPLTSFNFIGLKILLCLYKVTFFLLIFFLPSQCWSNHTFSLITLFLFSCSSFFLFFHGW